MMRVIFDPIQRSHAPHFHLFAGKTMTCPEQVSRADSLLAAARAFGCELKAPRDFGLAPIRSIHDAGYLDFLRTAHERWVQTLDGSSEVVPHVYAIRQVRGCPTSVLGQAGLYMMGTNCSIGESTWRAAYASAQTAIEAAELVRSGDSVCYGLCRPPGHHAYYDLAGGFCYLNNAAIAATHLRKTFAKVAIIDIDVHHGNGTQEIFYRRSDIHFTSIHADPSSFFPFYLGYAQEQGEGDGLGCNRNCPLP